MGLEVLKCSIEISQKLVLSKLITLLKKMKIFTMYLYTEQLKK